MSMCSASTGSVPVSNARATIADLVFEWTGTRGDDDAAVG